jgi:hypothetical protein
MSATERINKLVRMAIPKSKPVQILWHSTGIGKSQILRIITPAWKSLPRSERILKIQRAIEPSLNEEDRERIFRISVLTKAELRRFQLASGQSKLAA